MESRGLRSFLVLFLALFYHFHHAEAQGRGAIRLVRNGLTTSTYSAGIVEIYFYTSSSGANRWGNMCYDTSFGLSEANVICNQLGYNGASGQGRAGATTIYGTDGTATILSNVQCSNSLYLTIQQCTLSTSITTSCILDANDAYVVCYTTRIWENPYSGQIRLQGGIYSNYGRLEVYCNGQWGTVCGHTFNSTDARVACRQLGYSDSYTCTENLVGTNSQPIWLDNLLCSSTYHCLAFCQACPITQDHNCGHSEDVALRCEYDSNHNSSNIPANILSTCQYADSIFSIDEGIAAVIGGIAVAVFICCVLIIAIPICIICILCCLGIGIGAATARRGSISSKKQLHVVGGDNVTAVTSHTNN